MSPLPAPPPSGYWIEPAPLPGWRNMAIDHAMLDLAETGAGPLWRLYRWDPFCLSFGRHEPAARRYDRRRVEALGLDCVRRPTGGRAVWHARELTYAVAGPITGDLRAAYRLIHARLAEAVSALGGAPVLAGDRVAPGVGSGPCFAVAVGGELVIAGKKVLGSAQRRGDHALLQHGSLLLEDDQAVVRSVQAATAPAGEDAGEAPEAPLSALLGRPIGFATAAGAVARVLEAAGISRLDGAPNEVLRRASTHYDSYRSDTWTWER